MVALQSNDPWTLANIHERTGGSQRRIEAVDITLRSTITLCNRCHEDVERNRMTAAPLDPEQGYNGRVVFAGRRLGIGPIEPIYSDPSITPQEARLRDDDIEEEE